MPLVTGSMSEAAAAAVDVPPRGNGSRYRKIKHLGEGQFGMVYSAEDLGDGKTYAVKKIKVGRKEDAVEGEPSPESGGVAARECL